MTQPHSGPSRPTGQYCASEVTSSQRASGALPQLVAKAIAGQALRQAGAERENQHGTEAKEATGGYRGG